MSIWPIVMVELCNRLNPSQTACMLASCEFSCSTSIFVVFILFFISFWAMFIVYSVSKYTLQMWLKNIFQSNFAVSLGFFFFFPLWYYILVMLFMWLMWQCCEFVLLWDSEGIELNIPTMGYTSGGIVEHKWRAM